MNAHCLNDRQGIAAPVQGVQGGGCVVLRRLSEGCSALLNASAVAAAADTLAMRQRGPATKHCGFYCLVRALGIALQYRHRNPMEHGQ